MEEEPVLMKAKEGRKRRDTRRPPVLLDLPFFWSHSGTDFESDTPTLGPAGVAFVGVFVTLLEVMGSADPRGDKGKEELKEWEPRAQRKEGGGVPQTKDRPREHGGRKGGRK